MGLNSFDLKSGFSMQIEVILNECGLATGSHKPVYGGDINTCFFIEQKGKRYFLKVNEADLYPQLFQKEMKGLNLLREQSSFKIPEVIKSGVAGEEQYLLMEWLESAAPKTGGWKNFGETLAQMHNKPGPYFGLDETNYLGSLLQVNTPSTSWADFYFTARISPLVKRLFDQADFSLKTVNAAEAFGKNLNEIFPDEPPALLHGDLWSGNFLFTPDGRAALFDPAVYYGHREIDLAMTRLFGGFDTEFYKSYQDSYPLEPGWEKRLRYAQLYPLLVHALLFGGHYIHQCREILDLFL